MAVYSPQVWNLVYQGSQISFQRMDPRPSENHAQTLEMTFYIFIQKLGGGASYASPVRPLLIATLQCLIMVPRSLGGLNQIFLGRPLLRTQSFWFGTARLLLWSPSFKSHKGEDTIFLEFYKGEKIARPLLKTRSFSFGAARLLQHTRPSRKYPTRLLIQPAYY